MSSSPSKRPIESIASELSLWVEDGVYLDTDAVRESLKRYIEHSRDLEEIVDDLENENSYLVKQTSMVRKISGLLEETLTPSAQDLFEDQLLRANASPNVDVKAAIKAVFDIDIPEAALVAPREGE